MFVFIGVLATIAGAMVRRQQDSMVLRRNRVESGVSGAGSQAPSAPPRSTPSRSTRTQQATPRRNRTMEQQPVTTTSINTAAWLIGRGFEPIADDAHRGKPALV